MPPLAIPAYELPVALRGTGELPKSRWALLSRLIDTFIREDREMRASAAKAGHDTSASRPEKMHG